MSSCPCCLTSKQQLYCAKCLNEGIRTHRNICGNLHTQSLETRRRAEIILDGPKGISAWRKLRAEVHDLEERVKGLQSKLQARFHVPHRQPARRHVEPPLGPPNYKREQLEVSTRLVHARQVLVREAISVFGVKRDSIAGLPLPKPEDFQQYPTSHTNAAILHTIHLLSLIQQYLSIEVPFVPITHRSARPTIIANTPFTSTSKYRTVQTVQIRTRSTAQSLTAFALFCHSISYLAWSQGVSGIGIRGDIIESDESETEDPESQILIPATSILELLETMSQQSSLGLRSHAPGATRLRDLGFGLDVKRVVQALLFLTTDEEGWHLVEHASENKMHAQQAV